MEQGHTGAAALGEDELSGRGGRRERGEPEKRGELGGRGELEGPGGTGSGAGRVERNRVRRVTEGGAVRGEAGAVLDAGDGLVGAGDGLVGAGDGLVGAGDGLVDDDWSRGRSLVSALLGFTVVVIGMDALFDQVMLDQQGVIGLTDAVAAPFLRPFEALTGADSGWATAGLAVAAYAVATMLILRALRRAEEPRP